MSKAVGRERIDVSAFQDTVPSTAVEVQRFAWCCTCKDVWIAFDVRESAQDGSGGFIQVDELPLTHFGLRQRHDAFVEVNVGPLRPEKLADAPAGKAVWMGVIRAIKELLDQQPPGSGTPLH